MKIVEPRGLTVIFAGEHERVEKDEHDDEPVEELRLDGGVNATPKQMILVLNPTHDLIEALAHASLAARVAFALTATLAVAASTTLARASLAALAAASIQLLLTPAFVLLVLARVYLGLPNPQYVVLVGLFDLTLLFELLQVASLFRLLSLLRELAAQHTEYEVHDEERADYDQRDEVEVRPRAAFRVVNLITTI